ncbi:hypothetical protein ACQEVC_34250 [Plantactinospora sp. CA-294935]|uniref:hypothetical protein n=1 Tax=Plantactinospora sp. CA-294935 TaxID=3240012 RepID=UPI003D91D26E
MTVETTKRSGLPIRVDELRRGDHVVFLAHVVEVLDVARHPDFDTALQVMLRRVPEGKPVSTLLAMGHLVMGMHLPRRVRMRCHLCGRPMLVDVDVALGSPRRALCTPCSVPVVGQTVLMRAIQPRRHN